MMKYGGRWIHDHSQWTLELLTTLVESRHKDTTFDKTDTGVIQWLRLGMTPKAALEKARQVAGPTEALQIDVEGAILS